MPASGEVRSVNIGQARKVAWRGRVVRTAIWKQPVAARVWAGRFRLAGDQQADLLGRGGEQRAIMVYQLASDRYWAEHLGRSNFTMGRDNAQLPHPRSGTFDHSPSSPALDSHDQEAMASQASAPLQLDLL